MSDKTQGVIEVLERLKVALNLPDEASLAPLLGMSRTALNNRKVRGSMPAENIDALVEREGLNPEFIYNGTGNVMVEDDGHTWHDGFVKRLQHLNLETMQGLLVREGHKPSDIKAVAAGKQQPTMELLRDWRRIGRVDLNWVINGDLAETPSEEEQALLMLYRKAAPERQKELLAALVVESTRSQAPAIKQKSGKQSVQVAGNLDTGSLNLGNTTVTQDDKPQGRKTKGR